MLNKNYSRGIKNRKEIIEQLTDLLMQFDKDCNQYQTDVYLYFDRDTNTATLDTFVNVGGNSWLNDDHYTIYCDGEHYEDWRDWYTESKDFAWALDMDWDFFAKEVISYLISTGAIDEEEATDYKVTYSDCYDYVKNQDMFIDKLYTAYYDSVDEHRYEYTEIAEDIFGREEVDLLDWINKDKEENNE